LVPGVRPQPGSHLLHAEQPLLRRARASAAGRGALVRRAHGAWLRARADRSQHGPGGYFALFVAGLAERYYGIAGLKQRLLGSDTNPDQLLTPPAFTTTASGAVPDATFGYLSSAVDRGLHYIAPLPPQINLSDPDLARFYSRVSFTNSSGNTFRGAPIYDSVTVLQRSAAEQTAIDFVRLLLSPQGRRLQEARGFLDTPVLVGGDSSEVPRALRRYIDGCYEQERGGRRRHHHARR
jgi:hypothetical protein